MNNKFKKMGNISIIVFLLFVFFFAGVVAGLYYMNNMYSKMNSAMTANSTNTG